MKVFLLATTLALVTPPIAHAAVTSCTATALDKKLAGAAKTSFMNKCKSDTVTDCNKQAADKKLAGAAKTSFTTKCVNDGVGS